MKGKFAVLTTRESKYLTARDKALVLTDTVEEGSRWIIYNPFKANLNPHDGWYSLESASDTGRFLRHYSFVAYALKKADITPGQTTLFPSDVSWKFVDAH